MKSSLYSLMVLGIIVLSLAGCSKSTDFNDNITYIKLNRFSDGPEIKKSGTYVISGELFDEKIDVEAQGEVRIILSGVNIQNDDNEAIKTESDSHTIIELTENTENILTCSGDAAINAKGSIEICGNGNLLINNKTKHGIESDSNITIESGNIEILSYEHGIKSESKISIRGGNINIQTQTGKGIKAEKEYIGDGGNVTIYSMQDEGLESKGALTINDGNYKITSFDDAINAGTSDSAKNEENNRSSSQPPSPEGFEGEPPRGNRPKKMPIKDGETMVVPEGATTSGRGVPFDYERTPGGFGKANADSVITINGGTIKINTFGEGDGIDSNGSLSINGGTVIIDGPQRANNGALDSDGKMLINNATVLTASSRGMEQYPVSMSQSSLIIDFDVQLEQGTKIKAIDNDNNILFEHTTVLSTERIYFTSPEVKNETVYTVYIDDNEYSTVTSSMNLDSFRDMGVFSKKAPGFSKGYKNITEE